MAPGTGGAHDDSSMQLRHGTKMLHAYQGGLDATGGLGTGAPVMAEIGASGQAGLRIGAAADLIYWKVLLDELYMDRTRDILARVHFSAANVDTGIDWIASCLGLAGAVATPDAVSSPDGLITFPEAASLASEGLVITPFRGFGVPGTFATDAWLLFALECDSLGTASADEIELWGLELKYTFSLEASDGVRVLT